MWLRLDDRLYTHPKVDTISNAALGLWTRTLSWSGDKLTDGFIPNVDMRRRFKATPAQITALVQAGLWVPETVDGVEGWRFHNFEKWNEPATKAGVKKRRRKSRKSSQTYRDKTPKNHQPDQNEHTSEPLLNQNEHTSESEWSGECAQNEHDEIGNTQVEGENIGPVTDHESVTLDPDPDPDPDPTELRGVGKGQGSSDSGPHDSAQALQAEVDAQVSAFIKNYGAGAPGMDRTDTCPRHAHIPPGEPVPPCHDCRNTRLANEQAAQDHEHTRHRQAQARRDAIAACLWCDECGWALDPDTGETLKPARKCTHRPATSTTQRAG